MIYPSNFFVQVQQVSIWVQQYVEGADRAAVGGTEAPCSDVGAAVYAHLSDLDDGLRLEMYRDV